LPQGLLSVIDDERQGLNKEIRDEGNEKEALFCWAGCW